MKFPTIKILSNLGGRNKGGLKNVEYSIYFKQYTLRHKYFSYLIQ